MKFPLSREKRLNVRRPWRSRIVLEDEYGEGVAYLYSRDISLSGLFLDKPPPLKLGAQLFLSFVLPGRKRPMRVTGQVVRFVEEDIGEKPVVRTGAGVRFIDVDPKTRQILSEFIQEENG